MPVAKRDGLADGAHTRVAEVAAHHERTLMRIARQASLCHDDALDAYQRALEIFVRRVDTVDPATEVAWLKVVVRHEAMAIRRARTESVVGEELDFDTLALGAERSVEDQIASNERVRRSAEALRALKPDEATALIMKAHGLSYAEIGERKGWSYTKVNRAVTEGRRRFIDAFEGIESGAECERYAAIVQDLAGGSATAAQLLAIRPHLRHCGACRATVRDLRLSAVQRASLFWPIFAVAEPLGRLTDLKNDVATLFHRAHASDLATSTGLASTGGGGRIATVATALGMCLSGATVGTVCVVTGTVPDLGFTKPAREASEAPQRAKPERRTTSEPRSAPRVTAAVVRRAPRAAPTPTPRATPAAVGSRRRHKRASKAEAAPREFGFENQAPAAPVAQPSTPSARAARAPARQPTSQGFSPAEQEFAP